MQEGAKNRFKNISLPIDLLEKPEQTLSPKSVDKVTIMELEDGKLIRLGSALEGENCFKVLEVL